MPANNNEIEKRLWNAGYPFLLFGFLGLGSAALVTVFLRQVVHLPIIASWFGAINLSALVTYRADKAFAQADKMRVPEKVLWLLEAVGGTIGAVIAMWIIQPRHKTRSGDFLLWFFVIFILQLVLVVLYFVL